MKIGIFLESHNNQIIPVGLELIGKARDMMADRSYELHGILVRNHEDKNFKSNLDTVANYLDQIYIFEYPEKYLTTEHYQEALCEYVEKGQPKILLLGATSLGRSFGPRVAAYFKTGMTADCTEIKYDDEDGLVQIRPAFGEELIAEIVTPDHYPQMATVRPGVMDPPLVSGEKNSQTFIYDKILLDKNLTVLDRLENKEDIELGQADIVVVAGNAIKEEAEFQLVKRLSKLLGGDYGVTRPLVEGGLAPHTRQIGVSGTILSASLVLLLGVSGSNQTLAGIEKAKKIIAVNKDPHARIFNNVDIGIIDDWKDFTVDLLRKKEKIENEKN